MFGKVKSMRDKKLLLAVLVASAILNFPLLSSPSLAAIIPGTFDCELSFKNQKTDSFLIACADGNEFLSKIKWATWTKSNALGVGKYGVNNCQPNCADGKFQYLDVKVSLSGLKTIKGRPYFTYIDWWQIDKKGRRITNGKFGGWDLYQNFKEMGGNL